MLVRRVNKFGNNSTWDILYHHKLHSYLTWFPSIFRVYGICPYPKEKLGYIKMIYFVYSCVGVRGGCYEIIYNCQGDSALCNVPIQHWHIFPSQSHKHLLVDCVWNVMAHTQKPDFVFWRNGRVHLNRQGHQFCRLLAAEVCASAVVMLDTPSSKVVWRVLATHSIRQFLLHFPSLVPCAITFQLVSTSSVTLKVEAAHSYKIWEQTCPPVCCENPEDCYLMRDWNPKVTTDGHILSTLNACFCTCWNPLYFIHF